MSQVFRKIEGSRLLGIDPSLTQSGWALFSLESDEPLEWGVLKPAEKTAPLSDRLLSLHRSVEDLFNQYKINSSDYLVCEGPAPVSLNPSSTIKVEQVRGIFEGIARTRGAIVPGRLNPRTLQSELLGLRGKQAPRDEVKRIARAVLAQMFSKRASMGIDITTISQDAVDAILIGVLARSKIQYGLLSGAVLPSLFEGGGSRNSGRRLRWTEKNLRIK